MGEHPPKDEEDCLVKGGSGKAGGGYRTPEEAVGLRCFKNVGRGYSGCPPKDRGRKGNLFATLKKVNKVSATPVNGGGFSRRDVRERWNESRKRPQKWDRSPRRNLTNKVIVVAWGSRCLLRGVSKCCGGDYRYNCPRGKGLGAI